VPYGTDRLLPSFRHFVPGYLHSVPTGQERRADKKTDGLLWRGWLRGKRRDSFHNRSERASIAGTDILGSDNTEFSELTFMAVLILAVVLIIITGAQYFGRPLTRPVWLVLFILSALALLLLAVAYRSIGI
jgi:hypothetical protein